MGIASLGSTTCERAPTGAFAAVAHLIQGIAVALITTVDATGIVRTRELPNINTGFEDDISFLATSESTLVTDLRGHPDVVVTFADRSGGRFVVVNGVARVANEMARIRKLWHPVLASWLPGGPDNPALALIQVQAQHVELWDYRSDRATAPAGGRE